MIVPIGHEKAVRRLPWVTIGIILLNTIIFVISLPILSRQIRRIEELQEEYISSQYEEQTEFSSYEVGEPNGDEEESGNARPEQVEAELRRAIDNLLYHRLGYTPSKFRWYTLFTSLFLHAGFLHLVGNLWFLYLVGSSIEDLWGRRYFLCFYLASGIIACLLHGAVYRGSTIPVIGASGAIAGLMGAFMIRNYKVKIKFFYFFLIFIYPLYGTFHLRAYVALGGWFFMQLLFGTLSIGYASGVAYWAHIGGFLFGVGTAVLLTTQRIEERYIAPKLEENLEAVKLHPKLVQAFHARDRGDPQAASSLLRELTTAEPGNIDAHTELVNLYVSAQDITNAAHEYDEILHILSRTQKVDSLMETYDEVAHLGLAHALSPENQFRIAALLVDRGRFDEALDLYRRLVRDHPDHQLAPLSVFRCATILLDRMHKPDLACAGFRYILERYPRIEWKDEVLAQIGSLTHIEEVL